MIHGVFVFPIFGFIFTAGPRWQVTKEITPQIYLPTVTLMGSGWIFIYASLVNSDLLTPGLCLVIAGWAVGMCGVFKLLLHPAADRGHIMSMTLALVACGLSMAGMLAFSAGASPWFGNASVIVGTWGFLLPVFFTVMHRMLPFFSSMSIPHYRVIRPRWLLWVVLSGSICHAGLAMTDQEHLLWVLDLPMALITAWLASRWGLRASFIDPLLLVLHVAFAWLPIGLVLSAISSLMFLFGLGSLGMAPLHALTLGCFTSLIVGMGSRVTLVHSGKPLVADGVMWFGFWAIQVAAILRVGAVSPEWGGMALLSAMVWIGAFVLWGWHYAPFYWRPKEDGVFKQPQGRVPPA